MSKPIKVNDQVYEDLDQLRGKGETFSYVIEVLLWNREELCRFLDVVEGTIKFREWQLDKFRPKTPKD